MSKNCDLSNYEIAKAEADKVDEQIIAALKAGRSFRVEAGAGSGKTYSLNRVIEWIQANKWKDYRRKKQNVICITYTNAYKGQNSFHGGCTTKIALLFCFLMKFVGKGKHLFPPITQEYSCRCIQVTEQNRKQVELLLQGKIIDTPGHTADSISLLTNDGSLFCGDAAMNGLPSLHRITIWAEDKTDFLKSWETIIALRPNLIYPGHGKPFGYDDLKINLKRAKNMELLPIH